MNVLKYSKTPNSSNLFILRGDSKKFRCINYIIGRLCVIVVRFKYVINVGALGHG